MALIGWEPARELATLQGEMNRLFNTFFDSGATAATAAQPWIPAMDLVEQPDDYVLRVDLPGVAEDEVSIELENNALSISGERAEQTDAERDTYHRVERARGAFRRVVSLPEGIDPASVAASFDKGVLAIRIPKPEQRKPHRVQIAGDGRQQPQTIEGHASAS